MPHYQWRCKVCETTNIEGVDSCSSCGSNANLSALEIEMKLAGATNIRQYLSNEVSAWARRPYYRDFLKTISLTLASIITLWIALNLDSTILVVLSLPLLIYAWVVGCRFHKKAFRSMWKGIPYED